MPKVGRKHFSYSPAGYRKAAALRRKLGKNKNRILLRKKQGSFGPTKPQAPTRTSPVPRQPSPSRPPTPRPGPTQPTDTGPTRPRTY